MSGSCPQNYGPNVTVVGSLGLEGIHAAASYEGPTEGAVFRTFVQDILAPTLQPGDVVVMDNLSAHKVTGIREAIEHRGAQLVYLPPYSPDLSPIEQCWSKVKSFLRKVGARTPEALDVALVQSLEKVSPSDARGWFTSCGYTVHPI